MVGFLKQTIFRNMTFVSWVQVGLLFAFCKQLGLTSVVLVGHSDGGLLALMAAAQALKSRDSIQVRLESPLSMLPLICLLVPSPLPSYVFSGFALKRVFSCLTNVLGRAVNFRLK